MSLHTKRYVVYWSAPWPGGCIIMTDFNSRPLEFADIPTAKQFAAGRLPAGPDNLYYIIDSSETLDAVLSNSQAQMLAADTWWGWPF